MMNSQTMLPIVDIAPRRPRFARLSAARKATGHKFELTFTVDEAGRDVVGTIYTTGKRQARATCLEMGVAPWNF